MPKTILIADDEPDITNLLQDYFEINGYKVITARNGMEALQQIGCGPDIILLDINMSGVDGIEVCTRIRDFVSCPIIFLTAKIGESDKINGFRVGGDDYITKPFSIDELGARVTAHLRREQRQHVKNKMKFTDDLIVDYSVRRVYHKNHSIFFAKKEFDIIELLSLNSGQIFDKERIYERLWGCDSEGSSNVVSEHIRRIRAKLSKVSGQTYIATVWGVGYRWVG
jgi:DNA-binding response OmpR family regulator